MSKIRVAVLNSHPIQYFAPLYARLNEEPALEVVALYCTDFSVRGAKDRGFGRAVKWDVDLFQGYRAVFLGERSTRRTPSGFWSLIVPEVWREVRNGGYDVLWLHGYAYAACLIAFLAAKSRGMPVFMRSETHLKLHRSGWRQAVRDQILRAAYRFVDGFLAIGNANAEYYRWLGVPEEKIFSVPYTVDNARFSLSANCSAGEREAVRDRYGLPAGTPVVLYASKLMPRKRPQDLLQAAALLRDEGIKFHVLIVGTGEMETSLRRLADQLRLDNVSFGGFVNQSELPRVYAASDVFVLPSEDEPWGLIVNEVMCAGLPVVVSDEVGCTQDLVREGVNGVLFKARDVAALAGALRPLLSDASLRSRMGKHSRAIISGWSYDHCARGVARAAIAAVAPAKQAAE
jgi:glycosyltransferase involved in cell wall biosynthesis